MKEAYIMVHEPNCEPLFIRMEEGDGSNLWGEEIEDEILDYIMYDTYAVDVEDWKFKFTEDDGGQILLEEYVEDMTMDDFINTVIDFVFGYNKEGEPLRPHYEVIESKE